MRRIHPKNLYEAAISNNAEATQQFIDTGADINEVVVREANFTILHQAASVGAVEVVQLLIENGADTSIIGMGQTAAQVAANSGYPALSVAMQNSNPSNWGRARIECAKLNKIILEDRKQASHDYNNPDKRRGGPGDMSL